MMPFMMSDRPRSPPDLTVARSAGDVHEGLAERCRVLESACAAHGRERDMMRAALDRLRTGVIVADPGGGVLFANVRAERFLSEGEGLSRQTLRRLLNACPPTSAARPYVAAALPGSVEGEATPSRLSAVAVPLAPAASGPPTEMLVLISETGRHSDPDPAALAALFGLTATEGRILCGLVEGRRPEELAAAMDVTLGTIRTHLRNLFQKTDSNRQSDLIRLALTTPLTLV
jgi:DNA-binding CsgD family transcriptional regulator